MGFGLIWIRLGAGMHLVLTELLLPAEISKLARGAQCLCVFPAGLYLHEYIVPPCDSTCSLIMTLWRDRKREEFPLDVRAERDTFEK